VAAPPAARTAALQQRTEHCTSSTKPEVKPDSESKIAAGARQSPCTADLTARPNDVPAPQALDTVVEPYNATLTHQLVENEYQCFSL
jgi:hypothetical protein